jgi:hypothetical protein
MTPAPPNPARGGATGSGDFDCWAAIGASDTAPAPKKQDPRAVREAKRLLRLEFLHEAAGGIQVHAALAQTFAEIGDTAGVCYAMRRLIAHVEAATPIYLELRDEGASNEGRPS